MANHRQEKRNAVWQVVRKMLPFQFFSLAQVMAEGNATGAEIKIGTYRTAMREFIDAGYLTTRSKGLIGWSEKGRTTESFDAGGDESSAPPRTVKLGKKALAKYREKLVAKIEKATTQLKSFDDDPAAYVASAKRGPRGDKTVEETSEEVDLSDDSDDETETEAEG
jgi:hypothetical protein